MTGTKSLPYPPLHHLVYWRASNQEIYIKPLEAINFAGRPILCPFMHIKVVNQLIRNNLIRSVLAFTDTSLSVLYIPDGL